LGAVGDIIARIQDRSLELDLHIRLYSFSEQSIARDKTPRKREHLSWGVRRQSDLVPRRESCSWVNQELMSVASTLNPRRMEEKSW